MINEYTIYETESGRIVANLSCEEFMLQLHVDEYPGCAAIPGKYSTQGYYVLVGQITPRPALSDVASWDQITIVTDGEDKAILSDLPNPSTVVVGFVQDEIEVPDSVEVTDGVFEFDTDAIGVYLVTASSFPYLDFTQEITAL